AGLDDVRERAGLHVGEQLLVVIGAVGGRDFDCEVGILCVEFVCELLIDLDVGVVGLGGDERHFHGGTARGRSLLGGLCGRRSGGASTGRCGRGAARGCGGGAGRGSSRGAGRGRRRVGDRGRGRRAGRQERGSSGQERSAQKSAPGKQGQ